LRREFLFLQLQKVLFFLDVVKFYGFNFEIKKFNLKKKGLSKIGAEITIHICRVLKVPFSLLLESVVLNDKI